MSARELQHALSARVETLPTAVVATDADGTLWSGDVSDDVFLETVGEGRLYAEALPSLRRLAERHGVALPASASASVAAQRLFEAFRRGQLPELVTYEMMAWCYAGWSRDELEAHSRVVLGRVELERRVRRHVVSLIAWARQLGLAVRVVSASPSFVLRAATVGLGFAPEELIGTEVAWSNDTVQPRLRAPVPYGPQKVRALRESIGALPLLMALGDSGFDLELLQEASFGVAVAPTVELERRLPAARSIRVLQDPSRAG